MKRLLVFAAATLTLSASALAAQEKPNILVIWGDDIGQTNISAYGDGIVGYQTPNIDRIANEGMNSPTIMPSNPARRAGPLSSPGRLRSAPDCPRSVCPGRRKACRAGRHHRRAAQRAGLRDRTVRQEPPW